MDGLSSSERLTLLMQAISTCHAVSIQDGELLASSPDEVALVKFAQEAGLQMVYRDDNQMKIVDRNYQIKFTFPFNSTSKRMGIILFDEIDKKYYLFVKGADTVMSKILCGKYSWLQEKVDQLSCEGLRTLVFGYKELSNEEFTAFSEKYQEANCMIQNREETKNALECELMQKLILLGITGVEDQLQDGVQKTLEMFRAAGIKTWILSGDKVQTIQCIALSSRLIDGKKTKFHVIEGYQDFE